MGRMTSSVSHHCWTGELTCLVVRGAVGQRDWQLGLVGVPSHSHKQWEVCEMFTGPRSVGYDISGAQESVCHPVGEVGQVREAEADEVVIQASRVLGGGCRLRGS